MVSASRPWRGMRYVMEEPVVRGAVYAVLDRISGRVAERFRGRGMTATQARVAARTYTFGVYFGALEQWHEDGARRPVAEHVREGLDALGRLSGPG